MSVILDIVRTYRSPRDVVRRRVGTEAREDRALAVLMGACALIFVAQWPRLSREAFLNEAVGFDALLAGALFGWLMIAPLLFYAFAFAVQGALRLVRRTATGYSVRMMLFWGLLAATPLFLLTGLTAGFVGEGTSLNLVSALSLAALLAFWGAGVSVIARSSPPATEA